MLAEKFFLLLEMLIRRPTGGTETYPDGAPKVTSQAQFVPAKLTRSALEAETEPHCLDRSYQAQQNGKAPLR
jgi:hypothetical protein